MKREIKTQTLETTTDEITVCDKCCLEAPEPIEIFANPKMLVHYGWTDNNRYDQRQLTAPLQDCFDIPDEIKELMYLMKHSPGKLHDVSTQMVHWDETLELCAECYEEVFSWGEE